MFFAKFFTASVLAVLSVGVAANDHASCTCHNGDSYNWRITTVACDLYNRQKWANGKVYYDTPSGRCTQNDGTQYLMGNEWEAACRSAAKSGFPCADGVGTCFQSDEDEIRGWC
ncbi:hypothetical protein MPH_02088 [Macrophomina phaseolina MS6]|uniref:Uncharacterized protein n=2 Tax=Macrophomina phaseolina TaxID=35725 RepID=K2RDI5_MACPH|nr:hypothetical protein MPH_02088 [Macrophomina phaseolina MS6]KAH7038578.1 hypothetical protein B0J12DRAFT_703194 [Macrophomina phaseolina]